LILTIPYLILTIPYLTIICLLTIIFSLYNASINVLFRSSRRRQKCIKCVKEMSPAHPSKVSVSTSKGGHWSILCKKDLRKVLQCEVKRTPGGRNKLMSADVPRRHQIDVDAGWWCTFATPQHPPITDEYLPRSRRLTMSDKTIWTITIIPPPPMPCSARQARNQDIDLAAPHSPEPSRNTTIDGYKIGFRPVTSLSLPQSGRNAPEQSI